MNNPIYLPLLLPWGDSGPYLPLLLPWDGEAPSGPEGEP